MVSSHLSPLIIAGPTGSGKSALAIKLALKHKGEIICADSRQFYKFMRIGTASPSDEDLALVAHHGFNSIDPRTQKIDAGFFVAYARERITALQARGRRPIFVGGTGLYLKALRYGISELPRSDPAIIASLEQECDRVGLDTLYERLKIIDKKSTELIMPSDKYRIMRALAIFTQTGKAPSLLRQSFSAQRAQLKAHWLLKNINQHTLQENLRMRIQNMFAEGMLEECHKLGKILSARHWALDVMGYKEAFMYINKQINYDQMIDLIIIRHRQYAKAQKKWFNKESFYRFCTN